jgi:tetratricopeptide (TPR) repeat protein
MWRAVLAVVLLLALAGCGSDSPEKYLKEGLAAFQQQDYDKAIENYEKAIAMGARSPNAYNSLGMAYRYKYQQTNNASLQDSEIIAFQKALQIDPKNWVAMINLGTTYYSRGEKARAASWFIGALTLNPNHPERAQIIQMIAEGTKERR